MPCAGNGRVGVALWGVVASMCGRSHESQRTSPFFPRSTFLAPILPLQVELKHLNLPFYLPFYLTLYFCLLVCLPFYLPLYLPLCLPFYLSFYLPFYIPSACLCNFWHYATDCATVLFSVNLLSCFCLPSNSFNVFLLTVCFTCSAGFSLRICCVLMCTTSGTTNGKVFLSFGSMLVGLYVDHLQIKCLSIWCIILYCVLLHYYYCVGAAAAFIIEISSGLVHYVTASLLVSSGIFFKVSLI